MAVNIPASFYKKAIEKFGERPTDPFALPALVSFVGRAEKSPANFKKAVADLKNNEAILNFIADVRDNLPPKTAELFQKYKDQIHLEMELKVRREQDLKGNKDVPQEHGRLLQLFEKVIEQATETNEKLDKADKKAEARGDQLKVANAKLDETQNRLEAAHQRIEEANKALAEEKAARIAAEQQREADKIENAKIVRKAKRRELFWGISTVIGTIFGAWGIWIAKTTEPPKPPEVRQESQKPSSSVPSSIREMKTRDIAPKEKSSEPSTQPEKPAVDKALPKDAPKAVGEKKEISLLFYNATRRFALPKAATLANVHDPLVVRRPVEWSQFRRRSFSNSGPSGRG